MWTLREVAEHIISSVNSYNNTVGSRINPEQVEAMIPNLRQRAIISKYNGNSQIGASKRIEGDWVQRFEIVIDPSIQDISWEFLLADCPKMIAVNNSVDGLIYVGRKGKTQSFKIAQTRDEINTLKARGFINNGKDIVVVYADNQIEIYGDKSLKKLWIEGILQDPSEQPGFSQEFSPYPVSASILDIMISIYKINMNVAIGQPKDTIPDSTDTNSIKAQKVNLV